MNNLHKMSIPSLGLSYDIPNANAGKKWKFTIYIKYCKCFCNEGVMSYFSSNFWDYINEYLS